MTLQQRSGLQFRDFGKNPNDFVNTDGRLVLDVPWNFKVQAMYQLPAGFLVSANFSHHAGPHIVRRATLNEATIGAPEGRLILLQPRGASWAAFPASPSSTCASRRTSSSGQSVRFSVFARRPEPPQRGRLRRRPELDRHVLGLPLARPTPWIPAA